MFRWHKSGDINRAFISSKPGDVAGKLATSKQIGVKILCEELKQPFRRVCQQVRQRMQFLPLFRSGSDVHQKVEVETKVYVPVLFKNFVKVALTGNA